MKLTSVVSRSLVAVLATAAVASAFAQRNVLKVGDSAPAIEVARWVKGDAVPSLDKGKIYVVEFWATWCGPCKVSIPHLTELHKKFGDKATFIGVSSFETKWDGVEPFVKSEGDQMDYDVAMDKIEKPTDREGFMAKNWMEAAKQNGIPTAFVVDKEGKIAWIGHPMELEQPLTKIVDGTWDREAAAKDFAKSIQAQEAEAAASNPARKVAAAFGQDLKAKKWNEAIADANKLSALDKKYETTASFWKLTVYTSSGDAKGFNAVAQKLLDGPMKDNPGVLNQIAWPIVDPDSKMSPRNLEMAHSAASKAVDISERKEPAYIDTLAWAEFWMGNKSKALDLENEALSKVTGDKSSYETSLKKFQG